MNGVKYNTWPSLGERLYVWLVVIHIDGYNLISVLE